ncbi:MAG: O-antigen ligase family protein [Alphaproteobacteria bacterium]
MESNAAPPGSYAAPAGLSARVFAAAVLAYPVLGLFAPKALVPLLVVAAAALLFAPANRREFGRALRRPVFVMIATLMLWSLAGVAWSPARAEALALWPSMAALAAAGAVMLVAAGRLGPGARAMTGRALVAAGVGFVLVFAAELLSEGWLTRALVEAWNRLTPWQAAMPMPRNLLGQQSATLAVFAWPCAIAVRRHRSVRDMIVFLAVVAAVLAAQTMLSSALAFGFGLGVLAVAWRWPRLGAPGVALVLLAANAALFMAAPGIAERLHQDPAALGLATSWQERIYVLDFVLGRVAEHPLIGWGLDASRVLGQGVAGPFSGAGAIPLHPHNLWAQLWLELGLVGLVLAAALVAGVLVRPARLGLARADAAAVLACVASYLVIGNISYGVWQNWWLALAWLAAAFVAALVPSQKRDAPAPT